ncbi:ArsR/SmtB family transcription factor [Micrococcoides hystricis]|uniref:ArsR/SmtB family transcription factor n=1 Tax=Micrococcoides hystricis TaxID=1572761 RepID=A0ABV6PFA9_9MICC
MTQPEVPPRELVRISDPQAIRALAHEARLAVLEELFSAQTTRTATELATRCGLTPSAMSYHLRALEKYGFVERAASEGDGRERRWKAAGEDIVVKSFGESPAARYTFLDVQINAFRERIRKEMLRRDAEDASGHGPDEDRAPVLTTGLLFLDEDARQEFTDRMFALIEEFEKRAPQEQRSVDGERMYYMVSMVPDLADQPEKAD